MRKRERILFLLAFVLLIFGMLFIVGCANQQAVNFSKQIMTKPHCIDALKALRAKDSMAPMDNELTEIELRFILLSGYEAIGKTEKEAWAAVEKLLKPDTGGE